MPRIFIIGDIHGCNKTFRKLVLEKIIIRKTDKIYCLGDYIDRGPDSKGVIDFILLLAPESTLGWKKVMLLSSLVNATCRKYFLNVYPMLTAWAMAGCKAGLPVSSVFRLI